VIANSHCPLCTLTFSVELAPADPHPDIPEITAAAHTTSIRFRIQIPPSRPGVTYELTILTVNCARAVSDAGE
jgi:hypothetical protein